MKRALLMAGLLVAACVLGMDAAEAGTMHGTVTNATTGKPVAGVEVILIQLQGGMQPVANTETDAQGGFSFDNPGIGAQPMLIRASYKGVDFHQPLPPGSDTATVMIYEPTQDPKSVSVTSHVVIFQPNGSSLTVGEEYAVQNKNSPPVAYFRADGSFKFTLPEKADLKQISATGPSGMPVIQAPIDKGKNRYEIAYAFQPGETDVRMSYELPYPNDAATVKLPTAYGGTRLLVAAPPSVTVTGDGLQPAGQEQGMNIYERDAVAAGTLVAVNLSGTAPPPSAAGGNDSGGQPQADSGQSGEQIQAVPGRLDALKWPVVLVLAAGFGLGAFLLAKKPVSVAVAAAGPAVAVSAAEHPVPAQKQVKQAAAPQAAAAPKQAPAPASSSMASLDAAAGQSLDALKDLIFRLELRHQAGTISEEEYAQERARAEQVLRNLVRG
jgi:Carboxypeptidase regulatory-like domain